MIIVSKAPDGLYLQRSDQEGPPLYVAADEVAQAIADMLALEVEAADWDAWAALCGNDRAALA